MALNFPDSPSNGDTTTLNGVSYTYDSTKTVWVSTTGPITTVAVSDTAPTTPTDGDMWFNSSDLKLYIRYNDGATSQWIIAAPAGPAGADSTVAGPAGPAGGDGRAGVYADMAALIAKTGMVAGDTALVTALNKVFMYTGSAWFLIATMVNDSPTAITGVDGSYTLATDGTATTITAVSTDPEGFALTWSYAVTSGSLGSTATVSQADNVFTVTPSTTEADAGTFSITFSVTDGATGAVNAVSSFTLSFSVANSRYTALSVKAIGTGSNQTFDDASTSNHTITVSNETSASTFSPYRAGGYSAYFQGPGAYLVPASTAMVIPSSTEFTIECWAYLTAKSTHQILFGGSSGYLYFSVKNDNTVEFQIANSTAYFPWAGTLNNNTWYYIAVVRNSTNTIKLWIDGVEVTATSGANQTGDLTIANIGKAGGYSSGSDFNGYISDFKVDVGHARYSSNFTPPTSPSVADSNTTFLLGRLPYFKDQSASNHAITPNGNVSLEPKSVYDNAPYSEASHGASAYFDGTTGNRLTIPHHADFDFSGDYVIEFWCNLEQSGNNQLIFDKSTGANNNWQIYTLSSNDKIGAIITDSSSNTIVSYSNVGPVLVGTGWHHFSLVRDNSAGTYVSYIDGVVVNTTTSAYNCTSTNEINIGAMNSTSNGTKGHISDFKFLTTIPSDRNAAFTPPTSPSVADSNTKFLLNPEPNIIDLAQKFTIGKWFPEGSTTQVAIAGTKSVDIENGMVFYQYSPEFRLNSTFTLEFWLYPRLYTQDTFFYESSGGSNNSWDGATGTETRIGLFGSYPTHYNNDGTSNTPGSGYLKQRTDLGNMHYIAQNYGISFNDNEWHHWAITQDSNGNCKWYLDGTEVWSYTISLPQLVTDTSNYKVKVTAWGNSTTKPYIQDYRLTKGLIRYTSNFTPPTAELEG